MKQMYFLISPNCNLKCKYCFQLNNTPELPGSAEYHAQRGVKADEKTIDGLAQYCLANDIEHVEIFGGEPLYYRELFKYAVANLCDRVPGMSIGVITNGTLITEEIMRLFETRPVSILLSLDGGRDRHNQMRGSFDRISPWFDRLVAQGRVSVAMQAGVVVDLYKNIRSIWDLGLKRVYINVIENHGWYTQADVTRFETEYELAIEGMLREEGELNCVRQLFETLKDSSYRQGCGITREGLACDWHGLLYPCHRAMEIGTTFAIGNIYDGIDAEMNEKLRRAIHETAFDSPSARAYPLVSFCPVAIYQKHGDFGGEWSQEYCEMISLKTKLVAKYYQQLARHIARAETRAVAGNSVATIA
jgi:uncharacterized protein